MGRERVELPTLGAVVRGVQVHAVLRGTDQMIRVWNGCAGKREEFTVDEARALCVAGDAALMDDFWRGRAVLRVDGGVLTVARDWLVAFLGALRGALRTFDAAQAMACRACDQRAKRTS